MLKYALHYQLDEILLSPLLLSRVRQKWSGDSRRWRAHSSGSVPKHVRECRAPNMILGKTEVHTKKEAGTFPPRSSASGLRPD